MFFSTYEIGGVTVLADGVFFGEIILIMSIIHSAIWSIMESETLPQQTPFKTVKEIYIAFIYWVSASDVGLVTLLGIKQLIISQEVTEPSCIQVISTICSAIFFIIIIVKITRWLLGIVRGHNTLVDNFRILKRLVQELMEQEQEQDDEKSNNPTYSIPQNERTVNMLGSFITEKRKEMGLSLAKLAKISGHPVSSLHGIENGDNQNPRFEIIIDLCQALDVSLDEMKTAYLENRSESK